MPGLWILPILADVAATSAPDDSEALIGTYTNEEQVYFQQEAVKPSAPWLSIKITQEGGQLFLQ